MSDSNGTHPPLTGGPTDGLGGVVRRNVRALAEVRDRMDERAGWQERLASGVSRFAGSVWSLYLHAALVAVWLTVNAGWVPAVRPWDPYPFVMLAMAASVEALFLSTFILVGQKQAARVADRRADLNLQISLLTEHEVTRAVQLLDDLGARLGVAAGPTDLEEVKKDVQPEAVMHEIERAEQGEADAA